MTPQPVAAIVRELAGETIGHFRIDDYVGLGGMGAVFRGTDLRLDRPVALKVLAPEQAQDTQIVARFQQEARATARLDHENIAQVYFIGEDRSVHFIAFEYVEGVNVRDLVYQCGPLPASEVVNYALQITGALIHAEERGVVHRDIKPSNIIITRSGRAKLVDMGLARNFERRSDGGLTESGVTLGTFDYIAPEQARDPRSADARSDIYSLGCTLFHMLTGRPPYPDGTVLQKLLKHQEDVPPDPRRTNSRVPAILATVVTRMMAKDPGRRYQTADELLNALLEVAANMGLKSTSPEGLIWVTDLPPSPLTWATGAVWLAAVAALVLAVIALYGRPGAPPEPAAIGSAPQAGAADKIQPQVPPETDPDNQLAANKSHAAPGLPLGSAIGRSYPTQPFDGTMGLADAQGHSALSGTVVPTEKLEVLTVSGDQDLRSVVARAPSGSIIELSGQYLPQASHNRDDTAGIRIERKRLIVRAAAGSQPHIKLAFNDETPGVTDWTLFTLVDTQVEFEGIHFEIDLTRAEDALMTLFSLKSSDLNLRRCSFFQTGGRANRDPANPTGEPLAWVADLDSGIGTEGRVLASKVAAQECFFGGGDGAFALDGPARLELRDCTLLPYSNTILVRSLGFPPSMKADLKLENVSFFGSGTPIFDLQFAHAAVDCTQSVFSHEPPIRGTLARLGPESRMEWSGRRNLYHGVGQYLVGRTDTEEALLVANRSEWAKLPDVHDEGSSETASTPWQITIAEARAKSRDDVRVADAFRLVRDPNDSTWRPLGARFVLPWGSLYPESPLELTSAPAHVATSAPRSSNAAENPSANQAAVGPPVRSDPNTVAAKSANDAAAVERVPGANAGPLLVDPQDRTAFPSLGAACARAEDGAIIEIRHDGVLREAPLELGDRHLTIRAAAGCRPTVEFVLNPQGMIGTKPRLLNIGRGYLVLRDLDIHVLADAAINPEAWTVITSRGADVTLEECTLTIEPSGGVTTTLVRFVASELDDPMMDPTRTLVPVRSQLQLRNTLVVGAGSLVRADPGVHLRVGMENCAVQVEETLMKVTGSPDRYAAGIPHELELHRSTIKTHGSFVRYEAGETRPWLPRLEVAATDDICVGDPNSPWLQFQSPRSLDELDELLRWKGVNNCYEGIETVWVIETTNGTSKRYDWPDWMNSPGHEEMRVERGPVEFTQPSDGVPAGKLTRNHFKPNSTRTAAGQAPIVPTRGADVRQIPAPPQER